MKYLRYCLLLTLLVGYLLLSPAQLRAAVGLFDFQAMSAPTGIRLSWKTGFEDNNLGFNLFRATVEDRAQAVQVNSVLIPSQSQGGGGYDDYEYIDETVIPNMLYYYWIETVGDTLQDPIPPASASWILGGGLATNTPGPTAQPTQTHTPTATPTNTPTANPNASPTATNTPGPTPTAGATNQPTVTPGNEGEPGSSTHDANRR